LENLILNINLYSFLLAAVGLLDFLKDALIVLKALTTRSSFKVFYWKSES